MNPVAVIQGNGPIVLGLPHAGTYVPDGVRAGLHARGQVLSDTDWHIEKLHDDVLPGVYDEQKSARMRVNLKDILSTIAKMAPQLGRKS